jgi:hypothetical protein
MPEEKFFGERETQPPASSRQIKDLTQYEMGGPTTDEIEAAVQRANDFRHGTGKA